MGGNGRKMGGKQNTAEFSGGDLKLFGCTATGTMVEPVAPQADEPLAPNTKVEPVSTLADEPLAPKTKVEPGSTQANEPLAPKSEPKTEKAISETGDPFSDDPPKTIFPSKTRKRGRNVGFHFDNEATLYVCIHRSFSEFLSTKVTAICVDRVSSDEKKNVYVTDSINIDGQPYKKGSATTFQDQMLVLLGVKLTYWKANRTRKPMIIFSNQDTETCVECHSLSSMSETKWDVTTSDEWKTAKTVLNYQQDNEHIDSVNFTPVVEPPAYSLRPRKQLSPPAEQTTDYTQQPLYQKKVKTRTSKKVKASAQEPPTLPCKTEKESAVLTTQDLPQIVQTVVGQLMPLLQSHACPGTDTHEGHVVASKSPQNLRGDVAVSAPVYAFNFYGIPAPHR